MNFSKDLKKLAKICREAGIKHYKDANIEFTLSDELPVKQKPQKNQGFVPFSQSNNDIETQALSDDALLMWSAGDTDESEDTKVS